MIESKKLLMRLISPLKPYLFFLVLTLFCLTVSRIFLMAWKFDRIDSMGDWLTLLGFGLRIDLASISYLIGIPAVISLLISGIPYLNRVWNTLTLIWLTSVFVLLIFMEASTPAFIEEYSLRPNRLFVEYLLYPKEVFSMLIEGHKLTLLMTSLITTITIILAYQFFRKQSILSHPQPKWFERPVLVVIVFTLAFLGARSSLQHRAINPSYTAFTNDPLVNSLTLNSTYSLLYAVSQMSGEVSSFELYPNMKQDDVITQIHKAMGLEKTQFTSSEFPTLHKQVATRHFDRPKNLVIILEESLGAQFVGSLGGLPLTPEYDKLVPEGWSFNNLYATGTRSVRGIEAVITGFVPTPARSTVKLPNSQTNFFTIAKLLGRQGYDTNFIYGGGAHFDNMKTFFLGNGLDSIIEEKDFVEPEFLGSWGVSDEDLFSKANQDFVTKSKSGKPFFSLVFSSSNHDPYEFPDNKIKLYNTPKNTRENAVKYADHAIGHFFKLAKKENYWKDTVFLVVADHDARTTRSDLVPIPSFHIPALILGEGITPKQDSRITSQIDLAPTLLSLIGVDSTHPMIGQDMTNVSDNYIGRAIMQFNDNQAYMKGNQVVILQPQKSPKTFLYENSTLLPRDKIDSDIINQAIAHPLLGTWLYNEKKYDLIRTE
ncbi:LTA synthase family protein [Marinomonas sp. RSW2]|uniref:LTA synthase family protein n=1 Tax=Marinomonas maritima TaxID=2940935 RepID=A0ABT5WE54_9GAMM|nr:LTA synthase family protein [Marinomonas maritima]MDE8603083.1 LTA synthase family protein [Marinomonas maritima]